MKNCFSQYICDVIYEKGSLLSVKTHENSVAYIFALTMNTSVYIAVVSMQNCF